MKPAVLELCAGAGGQALGLEMAGFEHAGLIENDRDACNTLRLNRPHWNVIEHDLFQPLDLSPFKGVDLLAGGLPCPPFSVAGKQLGQKDERNLFDVGINYVDEIRPRAVMFENVKGLLEPKFAEYRSSMNARLNKMGYSVGWKLIYASNHGVPQWRPRAIMVAVSSHLDLRWPIERRTSKTVGSVLYKLMTSCGWRDADRWRSLANDIAPTVVGGSKKHGGPDLGPSRSKAAWALLSVDARRIADAPPPKNFRGSPQLTVEMVARIQGFRSNWKFYGTKTSSYRQVGNAFPPPCATAVGIRLFEAISKV